MNKKDIKWWMKQRQGAINFILKSCKEYKIYLEDLKKHGLT